MSIGFQNSLSDNCVYIKNVNGQITIIIVWVDDLIISAPNFSQLNSIKKLLSDRFHMTDMGELKWFLGIEFSVEADCIKMNQEQYVDKILNRFNMNDCHPKLVPCDPNVNKDYDSNSKPLENLTLYREIVGSLIYIMTSTRPDLCYAVTKLSQKLSNPTQADLNLSKYTLRYLKGTKDKGLVFTKSDKLQLIGYSDSDWANSPDRKSISGYCFTLNEKGPLISWKSKKQQNVALSTCESEYYAMVLASQEANFLSQLLSDMQGEQRTSVILHVDNQGSIELAKNPVFHQRSKHISIKYHYIRSQVANKNVILSYIPTAENCADLFTKPITRAKLSKFNLCQ